MTTARNQTGPGGGSTTEKRPLRVLHLVGAMNRGGVESWLMNLLRNADREVLAIDLLTTSREPAVYDAEINTLGAKLIRLPVGHPTTYRSGFSKILQAEGPYDAVHSHIHHFSGLPLWVAKQEKVPVRAITAHLDTRPVDRVASLPRRTYMLAMRQMIHAVSTCKMSVSPEAAAALYGENWENRGVKIERLGLDLRPLQETQNRAAIRAELGLGASEPVIINVSRLAEAKNHTFLLKVFQAYVQTYQQGQLLLVGDGPLRPQIEAQIQQLGLTGRVHLLGSRPDVPRLLAAADAFLFPSLFEGLSLAIVEAQVAGLPCVISGHLTPGSRLPGSVYFTPQLSDPLERWVADLHQALQSALQSGRPQADGQAFDIHTNITDLLRIYQP